MQRHVIRVRNTVNVTVRNREMLLFILDVLRTDNNIYALLFSVLAHNVGNLVV